MPRSRQLSSAEGEYPVPGTAQSHDSVEGLAAVHRKAALVDSSEDPIIGLTLDGVITDWNPAAERLYGYSCEEALGASISMLVPPELRGSTDLLARVAAGEVLSQVDTQRMSKSDERIDVSISMSPIRDQRGAIVGAAAFTRDNRARKRAEELLERQRRQLSEAQAVGGVGSWEWDVAADRIEWSDELCRIYGLEPGDHPATYEGFLQCVHPDDRARVQAEVEAAYASGTAFSYEHRIVRPDGEVRISHANGEVITGDDGTPLRMLGTAQDITERREVERAKGEFTSVVSHELRTPLTSIRGSLGLLESGVLGPLPKKGQRMVEIAVENTDRLVRLINDILDIERIDAGTIDMDPEHCDAADLVERAIESVEGVAAEAQVRLIADARAAALEADPDRILQTLANLLSNAVKFSEVGATVRVSCELRDGEVLFQVADEGRGIPADKLETIFERFQQVDASDSREKGGTGLGLAICRTIVEHHGGRIWAESELGAGATFAFTLPAGTSEGSPRGDRDPDGDGPTILVCDDDAAVVEVVGAVLEQRGYRVVPAHSGEQALELALSERPDAILLDLLMPGMSGWEVAADLKRHPQTSDIPIVILSVLSQAEREASSVPVADWIQKPLDERALFAALERAISQPGGPFKVLIVEDDQDLAAILTATFERHAIETFCAADGREAIELSQRVLPDLLVLDIGLPEADGFEVVDWLRRHERLSALAIVVYTARELGEQERERLRLGTSSEFLTKGRITPQDFERRVIGLLARLTPDRRRAEER